MPKEAIHFDPAFSQKRWVAYFDLLGTQKLTRTRHIVEVFTVYAHAIECASRELHSRNVVRHTWFSDTFLMFSENDSISDFAYIEQAARLFAVGLIHRKIPFRGAISCGNFYGDFISNIYFGEALIEAYKYGEIQDWIGFVLCPSAVSRLSSLGFPATERRNYAFRSFGHFRGKMDWVSWGDARHPTLPADTRLHGTLARGKRPARSGSAGD